jgi:DNA-binding response OmpR family regulator
VEDEPAIRKIVSTALQFNGLEVTTAPDGEEGLSKALADPPDVIILDLLMPRVDGRSMYEELRKHGILSPVLILSAHGAKEAQVELGADAALSKPFELEELEQSVAELLLQAGWVGAK